MPLTHEQFEEFKARMRRAHGSRIPSGIRDRWERRIEANRWHLMGEQGAALYLQRFGRNIGAPKVAQLAITAEIRGARQMAERFWEKALELSTGEQPPIAGEDPYPDVSLKSAEQGGYADPPRRGVWRQRAGGLVSLVDDED
jgi:hypothetical protein